LDRSALFALVTWALARDWWILRALWLAALTAAIWLNTLGLVCTLLVLGQLAEALTELSRARRP
jgi:hypothetical protein